MLHSIENITINGVDLAYEFNDESDIQNRYFIVNEVSGRDSFSPELSILTPTLVDGGYASHRRLKPRVINAVMTIKGSSYDDMHSRVERLIEVVNTDGEDVEITFGDEPGRSYYGQVTDMEELEAKSRILKVRLEITCVDPFKYGHIIEEDLDGDAGEVINRGRALAEPEFILNVKKKTTFAMITAGASDDDMVYNLIGEPEDEVLDIVDSRVVKVDELGDTLDEWDYTSASKGSFNPDSNGIFVSSYGTGSGWHGPEVEKDIAPLEDFEIEFYSSVRTERPDMAFRTSLNFYDENMNELGLLRVWNKSVVATSKVIEARIGPYTGENFVNYLISSNNYNWTGQRVYNGIVRVTRVGNEYTFYAAHITQRGNHIESITRKYHDLRGEYAGKLRHIKIGIAQRDSHRIPNEVSIRRVKVTELKEVGIDQTPYIAYPGDVITFDHSSTEVRVNGEPRDDLLNFGGEFFKLNKGVTSLTVTPEDSFESKVIYTEKFL